MSDLVAVVFVGGGGGGGDGVGATAVVGYDDAGKVVTAAVMGAVVSILALPWI